jgi:hypothetical protein
MARSLCYTPGTWGCMVNIHAQRKVRLADLISAELPLSEWKNWIGSLRREAGQKVPLYRRSD